MKNNKNRRLISNYTYQALILLLAYSLLIAYFLPKALSNDAISDALSANLPPQPTGFTGGMILVAYIGRSVILLAPAVIGKTKFLAGWFRGGLIGAAIPELLLWVLVFNLLGETVNSCVTNDEFGSCGWGGLLVIFILIASVALQAIGMVVGGVVSRRRSH